MRLLRLLTPERFVPSASLSTTDATSGGLSARWVSLTSREAVVEVTATIAYELRKFGGIRDPIAQEGTGPFDTTLLAAAVSNAAASAPSACPVLPRLRGYIEKCAPPTDKPFAVNIPVGHSKDGAIAEFSRIYLDAVLAARPADSALAAQLTVLTTSAGFPTGLSVELHGEA